MLSLLDPSAPQVDAILDLLRDPKHLWSPYGIRSLSASHPEYGQGENYWKGPIWMQMNYLVLKALHNVRDCYVKSWIAVLDLWLYRPTLLKKARTKTRPDRFMRSFART
jgi:glycogen debranching enzyme